MAKKSSESTPNLPPDYELDDYWKQQVVLKDPKDEETEFYSGYAHFSTLYPLPEYVVKRAAAAPPNDWYKHHPFSNYVEHKRLVNENSVSYSYSSSENKKENNVKDQGFENNKQSLKIFVKKRNNSHSWSFNKETTDAASGTATATPHHIEEEDQNQLQIDHHQYRSRKSTTRKIILPPHDFGANQEPNEELINKLITAEVGGCCDRLMLVLQKNLFFSDVDKQQNRLSIPFGKVLNNFLSSEEEEMLQIQEKQKRWDYGVKLLIFNIHYLQQQQPCLEKNRVYDLNIARRGKTQCMS